MPCILRLQPFVWIQWKIFGFESDLWVKLRVKVVLIHRFVQVPKNRSYRASTIRDQKSFSVPQYLWWEQIKSTEPFVLFGWHKVKSRMLIRLIQTHWCGRVSIRYLLHLVTEDIGRGVGCYSFIIFNPFSHPKIMRFHSFPRFSF